MTKNRVIDSARVGLGVAANPGLQENSWPATGNRVTDNVVERSGLADLGSVLITPGDGNCFGGNAFSTSAPSDIEAVYPCSGAPTAEPSVGALDLAKLLDGSANPKGRPFRATPVPPRQPNMPRATRARARPAGAPVAVDLAAITVPPASS